MELAHELTAEEQRHGVLATELPDQGFAESARRWAEGAEFSEALTDQVSGGEFVRNVRLVADLLGQLAEIGSPSLFRSAGSARRGLERGVVALTGTLGGVPEE